MREQRLLERIGNAENPQLPRGLSEQELMTRSVVDYLRHVFNTRKGSVLMDPEFGMPEFGSMASRLSTANTETIADIELAIKSAIQKYEKRVSFPRVKILDKGEYDIALTAEVEATIKTSEGKMPVTFRVVMSPDGSIEIST